MNNVNKQEIQRWLNTLDEPLIWVKEKENTFSSWHKQPFLSCNWLDNYIYIIDDNLAELRKLQIDKPGTKFEYWSERSKKWKKIQPINWNINIDYRIKIKYKYPIFKVGNKGTDGEYIVKFTSITNGEIVFAMPNNYYTVGEKLTNWVKHTDESWQDVLYDEEKGLYDKQPVLCYDNLDLTTRVLNFYDTKNKTTFSSDGTRNGCGYDNYIPYSHPDDDFIIEMYKNLEE